MSRRGLAAAWTTGLCLALTGTAWSDVSGTLTRLPTPPGLAAGDRFGATVALGNDRIAVGAYQAQNGAGAVYLFLRTAAGGWAPSPSDGSPWLRGDPGEQLGFALAWTAAGDLLAGAPFARVGGVRCGAVYRVFANGTKALLNLPCEEGAEMGAAVASAASSAGSWTVVGARGAAQRAGRVYVGVDIETGGGFVPLPGASPAPGDELGLSVATDGKVVVAGAPFASRNGLADAGTALVFSPADSGWTVETLLPASAAARDAFGYAVAVASPSIAVGAPLAHGEGGAVHVFGGDRSDRSDREVGGASGPAQLGVALAFAGSQLFAGARWDRGGGFGKSGAVYLVPDNSSRVGAALRSSSSRDGAEFGFDLAGGPGVLVVGAYGEGGTGAAYVVGESPAVATVVQLLKRKDEVREADGGIYITVVVNPADHPDAVTVLLSTADVTARAGSDYEKTTSTVTFSPRQDDRQTIRIPVLTDSLCEGDETFTVSLSLPDQTPAGVVLGDSQETVTIHDTPALVLVPIPLAFAEQGAPVPLSVRLSCPPAGRVTVALGAEGGSGTFLPPVLTFPAGSTAPQQTLVTSLGTCDTNPSYKIIARVKSSRDPRYLDRQGETLAECVSSTLSSVGQDDGTLLSTDVLCNHGPVAAPFSENREIAPFGDSVVWAGADTGVALVGFGTGRVLWTGIVPPCRGNQESQGSVTIRIVSARTPPP